MEQVSKRTQWEDELFADSRQCEGKNAVWYELEYQAPEKVFVEIRGLNKDKSLDEQMEEIFSKEGAHRNYYYKVYFLTRRDECLLNEDGYELQHPSDCRSLLLYIYNQYKRMGEPIVTWNGHNGLMSWFIRKEGTPEQLVHKTMCAIMFWEDMLIEQHRGALIGKVLWFIEKGYQLTSDLTYAKQRLFYDLNIGKNLGLSDLEDMSIRKMVDELVDKTESEQAERRQQMVATYAMENRNLLEYMSKVQSMMAEMVRLDNEVRQRLLELEHLSEKRESFERLYQDFMNQMTENRMECLRLERNLAAHENI